MASMRNVYTPCVMSKESSYPFHTWAVQRFSRKGKWLGNSTGPLARLDHCLFLSQTKKLDHGFLSSGTLNIKNVKYTTFFLLCVVDTWWDLPKTYLRAARAYGKQWPTPRVNSTGNADFLGSLVWLGQRQWAKRFLGSREAIENCELWWRKHSSGYLRGSAFWEARGSLLSLGISSGITENDAGEPPFPRMGGQRPPEWWLWGQDSHSQSRWCWLSNRAEWFTCCPRAV